MENKPLKNPLNSKKLLEPIFLEDDDEDNEDYKSYWSSWDDDAVDEDDV